MKIKGKRGKHLYENIIIWEQNSIFIKLFPVSHFMKVQEDPRNNKLIESGLMVRPNLLAAFNDPANIILGLLTLEKIPQT